MFIDKEVRDASNFEKASNSLLRSCFCLSDLKVSAGDSSIPYTTMLYVLSDTSGGNTGEVRGVGVCLQPVVCCVSLWLFEVCADG